MSCIFFDVCALLDDVRKTVELLEVEESHYSIMKVKYIILQ